MKSEKLMKISSIIFLLVAILTIIEYVFIAGMFTGPTMMFLTAVTGVWNIIIKIVNKKYEEAILCFIAAVAILTGYLKIM